jgi:hypothetical protein
MAFYNLVIYCFTGIAIIALAWTVVMICNKESPAAIGISFIVALLFGTMATLITEEYPRIAAERADRFFATSHEAYSCELPDGYACKLRIKEWREDSVYWENKIKEVMEN